MHGWHGRIPGGLGTRWARPPPSPQRTSGRGTSGAEPAAAAGERRREARDQPVDMEQGHDVERPTTPKGPLSRLIPQAAGRRSPNVCGDSASSLNSRTIRGARSASASEPSRSRFASISLIASSTTLPVLLSRSHACSSPSSAPISRSPLARHDRGGGYRRGSALAQLARLAAGSAA